MASIDLVNTGGGGGGAQGAATHHISDFCFTFSNKTLRQTIFLWKLMQDLTKIHIG